MKRIIRITGIAVFVAGLVFACDKSFTDSGSSFNGGETGKGGSMARFAIAGQQLYTVSEYALKRFDIAELALPEYKDSTNLGFGVETIFPYGEHLFIGTTTGMKIYSIENDGIPKWLSDYSHVYSCDPVVVEGNVAYVTLNSNNNWCGRLNNRLDIIDISNLKKPELIKEYQMTGPEGLGIDGNLLFLCDDGLKVYDVTDKTTIKLLHHFHIKAHDVIPYNNLLIVTGDDGLYQYRYGDGILTLLSKIEVNNLNSQQP